MNVNCRVKFTTNKPLTQRDGLNMWEIGYHFNRIGSCTYQLKSRGEADSEKGAELGLAEEIKKRLPGVSVYVLETKVKKEK